MTCDFDGIRKSSGVFSHRAIKEDGVYPIMRFPTLLPWSFILGLGIAAYAVWPSQERQLMEPSPDGYVIRVQGKEPVHLTHDLHLAQPRAILENVQWYLGQDSTDYRLQDSLMSYVMQDYIQDQLDDCFKSRIDSTIDRVSRKLKQGIDLIL